MKTTRPKKIKFPLEKQRNLRKKAIKIIKDKFLPNENILKIILIGSSVKETFGKYASQGFRGSLYSDFDFIFFINENYKIPKWLRKEPTGKPFPNNQLNLSYRNKKLVNGKYDIEVFFIREKNAKNKKIQKLGEVAGIPMTKKSKHKYMIIK
ncbi:hypothetical protein KAT80_03310 [Candidatus Pacearchaeota archaeon]|nr:hypothetical protein [Candidatus Pacearchaeota archaeon]